MQIKVLLIEDSKSDAQFIMRTLDKAGYITDSAQVENRAGLEQALIRTDWDIVISDYNLPSFGAFPALEACKLKLSEEIPFVVVSGAIDGEQAVALLKAGAHDYLMKDNLAKLPSVVNRALEDAKNRRAKKKAEEELKQANVALKEKNKELEETRKELELTSLFKDNFLANTSHELRTPLNSILLMVQLLLGSPKSSLSDKEKQRLMTISESGNDLLMLINEILDLSKVRSNKMVVDWAPFEFRTAIGKLQDSFEGIFKNKNISFSVSIEEGLPGQLTSDKDRVVQILRNLLSNASKYTGLGGKVCLRVSKYASKKDNYSKFQSSKLINAPQILMLEVEDNGIGIAPHEQGRIFEAFSQVDGSTTRANEGTGLGLAIAKSVVEILGGEIHFSSELGKGSIFIVYLPFTSEDIPDEASLPSSSPSLKVDLLDDRNNITSDDIVVLIVEDDLRFAKILLDFTRSKGYKGLIVNRGDWVMDYVTRYVPNAIILDMKLPGKSGWQVIEEIKKHPNYGTIPIHVITGTPKSKLNLRLGSTQYLQKPVSLDKLNESFESFRNSPKKEIKTILSVGLVGRQDRSLKRFLANNSLDIIETVGEKSALKILLSTSFSVDCLVIDANQLQSHNGPLIQLLRTDPNHKKTPVIFLKNGKSPFVYELQQHLSTAEFIQKDNNLKTVLQQIDSFLLENKKREKREEYVRALKGRKVLVVDDNKLNALSLREALQDYKLVPITAYGGLEALELLENTDGIEAVLLDIMMPGMDGYEVTQQIRKHPNLKDIPIIMVTACAGAGEREKCLAVGANDYLSKPINLQKLIQLIFFWLSK